MIGIVAFISGAVALAYEVLWGRVLSNVIGATLFSSTVVIVSFFIFLSLGYVFFSRLKIIKDYPWKAFSLMQIAITLSIIPTLLFAFYRVYPETAFEGPRIRMFIQALTAVILIGPPSFIIGGVILPLIESTRNSSYNPAFVYGVNTLGGIAGIGAVAFYSIYTFGIRRSIVICAAINLVLSLFSFLRHLRVESRCIKAENRNSAVINNIHLPRLCILFLAFASGIAVLSFEVILLYAYRQVGQNSAWSFSVMLMLVISALGVASLIVSHKMFFRRYTLHYVLPLLAAGFILFPENFIEVTHTMQYTSIASGSFAKYIVSLLWTGVSVAYGLFLLMGAVFPWILRVVSFKRDDNSVLSLGRILGINCLGACLGAVVTQWFLIPYLGLWRASILLSIIPVLAWIIIIFCLPFKRILERKLSWVILSILLLLFALKINNKLPLVTPWPESSVVEAKCGSEGIVAVIRRPRDELWRMSINNNFVLSSSKDKVFNRRMSHIPLLLHPSPRRVCYIGLATGLTASGAVLHKEVESIDVVEISPLVTEMSLKHFGRFTGHFERDPRVRIIEDDGVHFMATTSDKFDVIIGDVFFPWKDGAQRLYSWEHFANIRRRLKEGGIFCQWIPFYQLDPLAFSIIAKSFLAVFPDGFVIRLFMGKEKEFIGFIAKKSEPFDLSRDKKIWQENIKNNPFLDDPLLRDYRSLHRFFLGKLRNMGRNAPLNTMDKPVLEPVVIRAQTRIWQRLNF